MYDTANKLLARFKILLVILLVLFFAYSVSNRVAVLLSWDGVWYSFSILTYMLERSDEYLSPDGGANKFTNMSI
jgi:hypothetical protein